MSKFTSKAKAFFGKESFSLGTLTAVVIAAVLAFNVIFYVLSLTLGLVIQPATKDEFLLSGVTDEMFETARAEKKKVKVSFCMTEEALEAHDVGSFVLRTAKEFEKRYPDLIELEYINVISKKNSKGEYVPLSNYERDMLGNEQSIARGSVIFECGNSYKVVTDYYSSAGFADFFTLDSSGSAIAYNGEEFFSAMVAWVLTDKHEKAYFTKGHSEQLDIAFHQLLTAAGYYVDTIDVSKVDEIPEDAGLVIISNPRSDFERAAEGSKLYAEIDKLELYLERGGKLYVSLDPYVKKLYALEELLSSCGISLSATEIDGVERRDIIKDSANALTNDGFTVVAEPSTDSELAASIANKTSKYSDGGIVVREACALNLSGSAKPLLVSSSSAVCETAGVTTRRDGNFCIAAYSELVYGEGSTPAGVFVVPSIYTTISDALVTNGYVNKDFHYALFEELFGVSQKMPYGCHSVLYNTQTLENLTVGAARAYTAAVIAIPALIALAGTVIIVKRKNR